MDAYHRNGQLALLTEEQGDIFGFRQKTSNRSGRGTALSYRMGTKNSERIPVVTLYELFELIMR